MAGCEGPRPPRVAEKARGEVAGSAGSNVEAGFEPGPTAAYRGRRRAVEARAARRSSYRRCTPPV